MSRTWENIVADMYNRKGKNNAMFHKSPSPETCKKISIAVKRWWAKKRQEFEESEKEQEEKR